MIQSNAVRIGHGPAPPFAQSLASLVTGATKIAAGSDGKTGWETSVDLDEDTVYFWRVRGNDGLADGSGYECWRSLPLAGS